MQHPCRKNFQIPKKKALHVIDNRRDVWYNGFMVKKTTVKDKMTEAIADARQYGIEMAVGESGADNFVNPDGSWNLNCRAVADVLAKHKTNGSPFSALVKCDEPKLMADKGRRLDITDTILKLGRARGRPESEDELMERLYEYFAICQQHKVAPTYPLFSVWCGMSIDELEKHHAKLYGLNNAVALCKETIRGFLELSAMDNALSPLIYFHQQKVYFGAVEVSKVQVEEIKSDDDKLRELDALIGSIKPIDANVIEIKNAKRGVDDETKVVHNERRAAISRW